MSLERILKILEHFGLSRADTEVYIYLSRNGPQQSENLSRTLKIQKKHLCDILRKLEGKGLITVFVKQTTLFSAISFGQVLEQLVQANMEQAMAIQENREKLLEGWRSISLKGNT